MRQEVIGILLALVAWPASGAARVVIQAGEDVKGPAAYGVDRIEEALVARGFEVARGAIAGDYFVLAGVKPNCSQGVTPPDGPEALAVKLTSHREKPAVALCGSDARGLMYAALDTAVRVLWGAKGESPFAQVRDTVERPYVRERGISIYTMQRAYFESRLYDENYWPRYFDMLAVSRINSFVVIFGYENGGFMAPLYPYFFNVEGWPGVRLVGITPEQQKKNTEAFRRLIDAAHERGIEVTAAIWDHIYRGGVQGGGIPGASDNAGKAVPGLVTGLDEKNLEAYTKAAISKFLDQFPGIDALQFRMHGESGLKNSEMAGFWHEVFGILKQKRPNIGVDLRAKELPDSIIEDALSQGLRARISTKYWMEQMGLPFHPTHVNRQNQKDRRHGYADLLKYPQRYKLHWQLWSGGTARLLLWADPEYVRRFAESTRLYGGDSFEVNEMLATKMLGEPHDAAPKEILNSKYRYYEYEFERYWHFYQLWGRLTYNPQTPSELWEREFEGRFGPAGPNVMAGLHAASRVLPRIVASSYRYQYFPTTRGWAEMMRQDDLPAFAGEEGSDTAQFLNPRDEARRMLDGTDTAMRRPADSSEWFSGISSQILNAAARAENAAGNQRSNELTSTLTDLRILAGLAKYHSRRLPGAVSYSLYKQTGNPAALDEAVNYETEAAAAWREIVEAAGDVYSEDLAFGVHSVGFPRHWKEELAKLEQGLVKLRQEQKQTEGKARQPLPPAKTMADRQPPRVEILPAGKAKPGEDFVVRVRAEDASAIRSVRLRYRNLTQFEDYQTADMARNPATGVFEARIPAAFIDKKWDLMFFVEAIGREGNGRMYPDLELGMPYVIVGVER